MKPVKHKPYSKTSYLPTHFHVDRSTSAEELLYLISLQQKENARLELALEHKEKEVAAYRAEAERLQGIVNGHTAALFGRSTEKRKEPTHSDEPVEKIVSPCKRLKMHKKRGAKPGHKGHGRIIPDLPERVVIHELSCDQQSCPQCEGRLNETGFTEESYQIDVEIRYIRVKHIRKRSVRSCTCSGPKFVTAPKPLQVIPKGMFTHGFLAHVLTQKYFFQVPLYRQTLQMEMQGLSVNEGSLAGSFHKLYILLTPLYELLIAESRTRKHWHADETGWNNFVLSEDKQSFNWWLWVFASKDVVVYVLDPSRSASVPQAHLGKEARGILSSDRFSAYAKLARETEGVRNAYCWAHVRRDFINAGKALTCLVTWADAWVNRIGHLYRLNEERQAAREPNVTWTTAHGALKDALDLFQEQVHIELEEDGLHPRKRKVLRSALRNWEALTVFLEHPEVPMDNNTAERMLRPAAVGRKNYYGSHATWSGEFAAMCMSLFQTAAIHDLNPETYMRYILDELAKAAEAPVDMKLLLPWNIPEYVLQAYNMRRAKRNPSNQTAAGG